MMGSLCDLSLLACIVTFTIINLVQAQDQPDSAGKNGETKTRNYRISIIASVSSMVIITVIILVVFLCKRKRRPKDACSSNTMEERSFTLVTEKKSFSSAMKKKSFTFTQLKAMTNHFRGKIFHGYMNKSEHVIVKVIPKGSVDQQNFTQFKEQVDLLLSTGHPHLVKLVGYCDDKAEFALIYEYMSNGDLKEHLSGGRGGSALTWPNRLKIAVEAALGLEYLHNSSNPPIIHRDITSEKILFDENFQTKLSLGISTSFLEEDSHLTRAIMGTTGCLDPEYFITGWMTVKSDVYSFGIVLLELITNQPIINLSRTIPHIGEWVDIMITRGDIKSILDPTLNIRFDSPGLRRFIELAMSCPNRSSAKRPDMSQVVCELKACLSLTSDDLRTEENLYMESRNYDIVEESRH